MLKYGQGIIWRMTVERFNLEEFYRVSSGRHTVDVEYRREVCELKHAPSDGVERPQTIIEEYVTILDKKGVCFCFTNSDKPGSKKHAKKQVTSTIDKKIIEEFKKLPEHIRKVMGI